jgi:hypothetical protein
VPDVERSTRIKARLRELFERHRRVDQASLDRFYDSERGYYPPEEAGEERDHFAICLASVDGELYREGDHDRPFALQSISKVFAYPASRIPARQRVAQPGHRPSHLGRVWSRPTPFRRSGSPRDRARSDVDWRRYRPPRYASTGSHTESPSRAAASGRVQPQRRRREGSAGRADTLCA